MTTRAQATIAHREDWDRNVFAGLEELGERGAPFEAWAWRVDAPERASAAPLPRFDLCLDIGPPPRLA